MAANPRPDEVRFVDGDTLYIPGRGYIRASGYDTPEIGQPGADRATQVLAREFAGDDPTGEVHRGRFGDREVSTFRDADGRDIGETLIERGYASPTRFSSPEQRFSEFTSAARGAPGGSVWDSPETREHRRLLQQEREAAGQHLTNISDRVSGLPRPAGGTFRTSTARGVQHTKAMGGALTHLFGEVLGHEGMQEWGLDVMEAGEAAAARFAPEIGTYKNVESAGDAWTYAVEALGENAITLFSMVATAGGGAIAARAAAGAMAQRLIAKHGKEKAEEMIHRAAGRGALAGVFASSASMNAGATQMEFIHNDLSNPGLVLGTAVPQGLLDAGGAALIFGPAFKQVGAALAGLSNRGVSTDGLWRVVGRRVAEHGTKAGVLEAAINPSQQYLTMLARQIEDPSFEMFSDEEREATFTRLIDAALKGGIVGATTLGAPAGVLAGTAEAFSGGLTQPEPVRRIARQAALYRDGQRQAPVYVEASQTVPSGITRGLAPVEVSGKGTFWVKPDDAPALRNRIDAALQSNEAAGQPGLRPDQIVQQIIGFGETAADAISRSQATGESLLVVQGLRYGEVVSEEVVTEAQAAAAEKRAKKQFGALSVRRNTDVEQILEDRAREIQAEEAANVARTKPKSPDTSTIKRAADDVLGEAKQPGSDDGQAPPGTPPGAPQTGQQESPQAPSGSSQPGTAGPGQQPQGTPDAPSGTTGTQSQQETAGTKTAANPDGSLQNAASFNDPRDFSTYIALLPEGALVDHEVRFFDLFSGTEAVGTVKAEDEYGDLILVLDDNSKKRVSKNAIVDILDVDGSAQGTPGTQSRQGEELDAQDFESRPDPLLQRDAQLAEEMAARQNDETAPEAPSQSAEPTGEVVSFAGHWKRSDVESDPDRIYVFGDNMDRSGRGGQAIIRGLPNARGIRTKWAPRRDNDAFFGRKVEEEKRAITEDVNEILRLRNEGKTIVMPEGGVGTGLADLRHRAPQVWEHLQKELERAGLVQSVRTDSGIRDSDNRLVERSSRPVNNPVRGADRDTANAGANTTLPRGESIPPKEDDAQLIRRSGQNESEAPSQSAEPTGQASESAQRTENSEFPSNDSRINVLLDEGVRNELRELDNQFLELGQGPAYDAVKARFDAVLRPIEDALASLAEQHPSLRVRQLAEEWLFRYGRKGSLRDEAVEFFLRELDGVVAVYNEFEAAQGQLDFGSGARAPQEPTGQVSEPSTTSEAPSAEAPTQTQTQTQTQPAPPADPVGIAETLAVFNEEMIKESGLKQIGQEMDAGEQIAAAAQRLVDSWLEGLGLESIPVSRDPYTRNIAEYRTASKKHPRGRIRLGEDFIESIRAMGWGQTPPREMSEAMARALETMAHETGHAIDYLLLRELPQADQARVDQAYQQWKARWGNGNPTQADRQLLKAWISRSQPAHAKGHKEHFALGGASRYGWYILSKEEWLAEHVGSYLVRGELIAPSSTVRRIVRSLARRVRQFYNRVARSLGLLQTDETIRELLDARRAQAQAPAQAPAQSEASSAEAVNVWHGSNENAALSNLAERPFEFDGRRYRSVEHAYQSLKSGEFDQATYDKYTQPGRKHAGNKGTRARDGWNVQLMENLVRASFAQNPQAAKALLATGDRTITHRQDRGIWAREFPRILTQVRKELSGDRTEAPTQAQAQAQSEAEAPSAKPKFRRADATKRALQPHEPTPFESAPRSKFGSWGRKEIEQFLMQWVSNIFDRVKRAGPKAELDGSLVAGQDLTAAIAQAQNAMQTAPTVAEGRRAAAQILHEAYQGQTVRPFDEALAEYEGTSDKDLRAQREELARRISEREESISKTEGNKAMREGTAQRKEDLAKLRDRAAELDAVMLTRLDQSTMTDVLADLQRRTERFDDGDAPLVLTIERGSGKYGANVGATMVHLFGGEQVTGKDGTLFYREYHESTDHDTQGFGAASATQVRVGILNALKDGFKHRGQGEGGALDVRLMHPDIKTKEGKPLEIWVNMQHLWNLGRQMADVTADSRTDSQAMLKAMSEVYSFLELNGFRVMESRGQPQGGRRRELKRKEWLENRPGLHLPWGTTVARIRQGVEKTWYQVVSDGLPRKSAERVRKGFEEARVHFDLAREIDEINAYIEGLRQEVPQTREEAETQQRQIDEATLALANLERRQAGLADKKTDAEWVEEILQHLDVLDAADMTVGELRSAIYEDGRIDVMDRIYDIVDEYFSDVVDFVPVETRSRYKIESRDGVGPPEAYVRTNTARETRVTREMKDSTEEMLSAETDAMQNRRSTMTSKTTSDSGAPGVTVPSIPLTPREKLNRAWAQEVQQAVTERIAQMRDVTANVLGEAFTIGAQSSQMLAQKASSILRDVGVRVEVDLIGVKGLASLKQDLQTMTRGEEDILLQTEAVETARDRVKGVRRGVKQAEKELDVAEKSLGRFEAMSSSRKEEMGKDRWATERADALTSRNSARELLARKQGILEVREDTLAMQEHKLEAMLLLRDIKLAEADGEPAFVVYNQYRDRTFENRPIIFLDETRLTEAGAVRALAHELGHVVMRQELDGKEKVYADLIAQFERNVPGVAQLDQSAKAHLFAEWFAEMFATYTQEPAVWRATQGKLMKQLYGPVLKGIWDRLRGVWTAARKHLGLTETFSSFVEALRLRARYSEAQITEGVSKPKGAMTAAETNAQNNAMRHVYTYKLPTVDARAAVREMASKAGLSEAAIDQFMVVQTGLSRAHSDAPTHHNLTSLSQLRKSSAGRALESAGSVASEVLAVGWRNFGQTLYGFADAHGLDFRHSLHKAAGKAAVRTPVHLRVQRLTGGNRHRIDDLAKAFGIERVGWGPWSRYKLDTPEAKLILDAFQEAAVEGDWTPLQNLPARYQNAVADYVQLNEDLYSYAVDEAGMDLKYRVGHVPRQLNFDAVHKDREASIEVIRLAIDADNIASSKNKRKTTKAEAEHWLESMEQKLYSDPMLRMLSPDHTLSGPSMPYSFGKLSKEAWRILADNGLMERDVFSVLQVYQKRLVTRGEWQKDGGYRADQFYVSQRERRKYEELGDLDGLHSLVKARAELRKKKETELETMGLRKEMLMQPTVRFVEEARKKVLAGAMTQADYHHLTTRVIPSALGTLGQHVPRRWRNAAEWINTYQMIRLLAMSFFASIMDAGITVWRTEDFGLYAKSLKSVLSMDKNTRKEKIELYKRMGLMHEAITAHYFNSGYVASQYAVSGAHKITETFFRLNFMHQWTEMMRFTAATVAQGYLIKHADLAAKGDVESQRMLAELGVRSDEVLSATNRADQTLNLDPTLQSSAKLMDAVNTFVDEAVLRPTAATRPWWANHPMGKIFFLMKGFMYAFSTTVLARIYNQAVQKGQGRMPSTVLNGLLLSLPMIAATLPLTMLGFELRRQIGQLGDEDWFEHWDRLGPTGYMAEMMKRSGYLGLLELGVMAQGDMDRGNFWLNAAMGPAFEQASRGVFGGELFDPRWQAQAVPVAASIPFVRDGVRSILE